MAQIPVDSNTTRAAAPDTPPLTFEQKKQLALGWLHNQYQAYERGGGKDSLQAWLQSQIVQLLQAKKLPFTLHSPLPATLADKTPSPSTTSSSSAAPPPPPPPPPPEPPLESEGLGPIEWLCWGWKIVTNEMEGLGEVSAEIVVDSIIETVEGWIGGSWSGGGAGDGSEGDRGGSDGTGLPDDGGGDASAHKPDQDNSDGATAKPH